MNRYRCSYAGRATIFVFAENTTEACRIAADYFDTWTLNVSVELVEENVSGKTGIG